MEKKKRVRNIEKQIEYNKRYRDKVKLRYFSVDLPGERYDLIDSKLKQDGITKRQFLEDAIDKYLNKE